MLQSSGHLKVSISYSQHMRVDIVLRVNNELKNSFLNNFQVLQNERVWNKDSLDKDFAT